MENQINRKQIMEEFLKNIARLSDEEYQDRVWIKVKGPECNDIDDAICDFFDDGDPILEKYQEFGINQHQYDLLIKLYSKLRDFTDEFGAYSSEKSTEKLVRLPQWHEIRILAKNVLSSFGF